MIIIWKGPAMLITISAIIVSLLISVGVGELFSFSSEAGGLTMLILLGVSMAVIDIIYRKKNVMDLFDLGASTVFFIIPTWLAGSIVFLLGMIGCFV